jgi:copper chaperone
VRYAEVCTHTGPPLTICTDTPPGYGCVVTIQTFAVSGMTCEHCVNAVRAEVGALSGVTEIDVELNAGATSTMRVSATAPLRDEEIAAALDEAGGYHLA